MININNKIWDKLRLKDVEKYLDTIEDDETFFMEFKEEDIRNVQLTKEISAFANSFGGYVFLGVNDSKKIVGCSSKWTELRINTIVCNGISPIPQFDIKKFKLKNSNTLYIIKVEEGVNPPYITNDGYIYHRVSSSSDRVKDANTLNNLYLRNQNNIKDVENKIYIPEISGTIPNNLCGYVDFGFSLISKNIEKTKEKVRKADIEKISEKLKEYKQKYSISKVGYSLSITIGEPIMKMGDQPILTTGGLSNFMEILPDGSFRCRIIICSENDSSIANISLITMIHSLFKEIYEVVFGNNFVSNFIQAKKYEKLTVLKLFQPKIVVTGESKYVERFNKLFNDHIIKYGNNIISTNNRIPLNGFVNIDKSLFDLNKVKFNNDNLYGQLFYTSYFLLGYIDDFYIDND
ncbi:MAG: ATP-binding protein [Clostridia bacterium]|nr:ATP-binding protein [Clostridia bacterium]